MNLVQASRLSAFSVVLGGWVAAGQHNFTAGPGELLSQKNEPIRDALQGQWHFPAEQGGTLILTCTYAQADAIPDDMQVLHFWLGQEPKWLISTDPRNRDSVKASSERLKAVVRGARTNCPPKLSSNADHPEVSSNKGPQRTVRGSSNPARQQTGSILPQISSSSPVVAEPFPGNATLSSTSLETQGIGHNADLRKLYLGEFSSLSFNRRDIYFQSLFTEYLMQFGQRCSAFLPPDKAEITTLDCATYRVPVNRYGAPAGVKTCAEWGRKPTGVFAEAKAANAVVAMEPSNNQSAAVQILRGSNSDNPLKAIVQNTINAAALGSEAVKDAAQLLKLNPCSSPALTRLQDNMRLYSTGGRPIHLDGSTAASQDFAISQLDSNELEILAAELIESDARTWMINRYEGDTQARLIKDSAGIPSKIAASYDYKGIVSGTGQVAITLVEGEPACLYFHDAPDICKTPDKTIIDRLKAGGYHRSKRVGN